MTAFRFFLGLLALLVIATIVLLFIPEQRHWAVATGFCSMIALLAALDEMP
jgi:hypothetical protein